MTRSDMTIRAAAWPPQSVLGEVSEGAVEAPSEVAAAAASEDL